jgi:hypothetical protein
METGKLCHFGSQQYFSACVVASLQVMDGSESPLVRAKPKEPKSRFQGIDNMGASSVLDK